MLMLKLCRDSCGGGIRQGRGQAPDIGQSNRDTTSQDRALGQEGFTMIDLAPFLGGTMTVACCCRVTIMVLVIDLGLDVPGVAPVVALHGSYFLPVIQ